MNDNYGKVRCCEFLPVAFAEKEDRNILPTTIETDAYNYGAFTGAELSAALIGSHEDAYELSLPQLISTYKASVGFTDIDPSRIFQTSAYNEWEDDEYDEDDDYEDDEEDDEDFFDEDDDVDSFDDDYL